MSETIKAAFERRLATYRTKQASADPFADDCYTKHDALRYVIDATELLAHEAGIELEASEDKA